MPKLATVDDGQATDDAEPLSAGQATVTRLHLPGTHGPTGRAVAGALAKCARDRGAAVVVVGSRGRSAVEEIVLGSVAIATVHHAYRPVLVAPPAGRKPVTEQPF
jgi:nucleotide-binding universal stress UspA family protein